MWRQKIGLKLSSRNEIHFHHLKGKTIGRGNQGNGFKKHNQKPEKLN